MTRQLHILTSPPDAFLQQMLDLLRRDTSLTLDIVDLTISEPDYPALVEKIFSAGSVATW